jgi:vitamin B12 transport system substrate-binding protein
MSFSTSNLRFRVRGEMMRSTMHYLIGIFWVVSELCLSSEALSEPSMRIITLTPHATELVFAAGAGEKIVATVNSSDFPLAARVLPHLGDGIHTSVEQILKFRPDWVVGWPSPIMDRLSDVGVKTWVSDPQSLQGIVAEVLAMASAFGEPNEAHRWFDQYSRQIEALGAQSPAKRPVRVLILADQEGEFALAQHGLLNEALGRCNGVNVLSGLKAPATLISQETILATEPEIIVTGHPLTKPMPPPVDVTLIEADWLYRPGPRFILAAQQLCETIRQRQARN